MRVVKAGTNGALVMTFLLVAALVFFGFFMLGGAAMGVAATLDSLSRRRKPPKNFAFHGPDNVVGPKHRH